MAVRWQFHDGLLTRWHSAVTRGCPINAFILDSEANTEAEEVVVVVAHVVTSRHTTITAVPKDRHTSASGRRVELRLPVARTTPHIARAAAKGAVTAWGLDAVVGADTDMALGEAIELIVDELITNAVLHARWTDRPGNRPTIELVLGERAGWFTVEVLDGDERLPKIAAEPDFSGADVDAADAHGIGLWSVESMVALWHGYWGWASDIAGKVVWLNLPTTQTGGWC